MRSVVIGDRPFEAPFEFERVKPVFEKAPDWYRHGDGGWGCYQAHLREWQRAWDDGIETLAVYEDDAIFVPDYQDKLGDLSLRVPAWDMLMVGGQHIYPPTPVAPGIVRCTRTGRTHGYIVRRPIIKTLVTFTSVSIHIDRHLSLWTGRFHAFAPKPFIVGQSGGISLITGDVEPERWFND